MSNKLFLKIFLVIFLVSQIIMFLPTTSRASQAVDNLIKTATSAKYSASQMNENTVADVVGRVAATVLTFIGVIFFFFILYSGLQWLMAGGKEDKISEARTRITQSIIGLAITAMAYFLTWFVTNVIIGN